MKLRDLFTIADNKASKSWGEVVSSSAIDKISRSIN